MKKLLKTYGLNSDMQYFEMIVDGVINGQRTQAKEQFKALPKVERKNFVKALTFGFWPHGLDKQDVNTFIDLI